MRFPFKLFTERWYLLLVPPSKLTRYRPGQEPERNDGDCNIPPSPSYVVAAKDRRVRVRNDMNDRDTLESALHELTHAAFPCLAETWVQEFAHDTADVLASKMGFHRKECDDP